MKERPIIFSGPMVRAILAGTKTQTRRVVSFREFQPCTTVGWDWDFRDRRGLWNSYTTAQLIERKSPYGAPGDWLWVRETWMPVARGSSPGAYEAGRVRYGIAYRADDEVRWGEAETIVRTPDPVAPLHLNTKQRWHPAIHMRRHDSRIKLEVTAVRVERLQAISERDAEAEGIEPHFTTGWDGKRHLGLNCRDGFELLWDSINGKRTPWASNPWVWVIEFRRVEAQEAAA